MRNLSFLLSFLLILPLFSCNNIKGGQENQNMELFSENKVNPDGKTDQITPEYLTYDSFLEKVWDFESNPQEWVYEGDVPCVIDFYADWCKPCKIVSPIMDELAIKYEGKVKIYKIDVDKEKKLASVFGIRSIPSVLFSPASGQPKMQAGALPKEQYIQIIETDLLNNTTTSNQ